MSQGRRDERDMKVIDGSRSELEEGIEPLLVRIVTGDDAESEQAEQEWKALSDRLAPRGQLKPVK